MHSAFDSPAKIALAEMRRLGLIKGWRNNLRRRKPPDPVPIPPEYRKVWAAKIATASNGDDREAGWLWHELANLVEQVGSGLLSPIDLARAMGRALEAADRKTGARAFWRSPEGREKARKQAKSPAYRRAQVQRRERDE